MLLRLIAFLAFKLVFFFLCQLLRWFGGVHLGDLFTVEEESVHIGGLLGKCVQPRVCQCVSPPFVGVRSAVRNLQVCPSGWVCVAHYRLY